MASTVYSCQHCSMHFSGPVPYMDHVKSARHQKKVATQKQLETLSEGLRAAVEPSMETQISTVPAVGAATLLSHSTLLSFVCKLCNVSMNCQEALIAHNSGRKHQKALQREEVLRQISLGDGMRALSLSDTAPKQATTSPMATTSLPPKDETMENYGEGQVDLSCQYCGIVLFKNLQYKLEHLETDAHYNKKLQGIGRLGGTPNQ